MAVAVVTGMLGVAAAASAQIPGMPLFTNPRYGTGIRVHADLGQPTDQGTKVGDLTVVQGGVTLALGPIGIGANLGTSLRRAQQLSSTPDSINLKDNFTASAIAQLRLIGGGLNPLALSVFGGATTELTARGEAFSGATGYKYPRLMHFPVGAAVGLKVPVIGLSVWGAGRYVFEKYVNCPSVAVPDPYNPTGATLDTFCTGTAKNFRWAVGADLPILSVISIRAAYDSGKIEDETVSYWGIGASIGLGGMR